MPTSTPSSANPTARTVTAGFGWLALCHYGNRLLGLVSTLILAKLLTPADFGLVAIAAMVVEIVQVLKDIGLSEAVIYSKRDDRTALDTAHTVLVVYNGSLFLLVCAAAPFVSEFYDNPTLWPVIVVLSTNLVINSLRAVPLALVRKNLHYRQMVIPDLVPSVLASVLGIIMAWTGFGVWSLVAKVMTQSVLAYCLLHWLLPFRPRFAFDRAAARELMTYGRFIVGSSVVVIVLYNIDKFYISRLSGIAALGAFELALRIAELPARQLSSLVGAVMFPVFSRMEQSGPALRDVFLRTLKYTASATVPAAIALAVFGPALVARVYGDTWVGLGQALRLLAFYAAIRSLSSIMLDLFKATGRPQWLQRASLMKLGPIGVLGAPAVYFFGLSGIAALIAVTWLMVLGWEMRRVAEVLGVSVTRVVRGLAPPLALASTIIPTAYALLVTARQDPALWELIGAAGVAGLVYLLGLYKLDQQTATDFGALRRVMGSGLMHKGSLTP